MDHTPEIDVEGPRPVLERHLLDGTANADTGVVAHDVHRSESVERRISQRLDLDEMTYVGPLCHGLMAGIGQATHGRVEALVIDVGEHHRHPGSGEGPSHRQPHAARGTGDHCGLALDVVHVNVSSRPAVTPIRLLAARSEGA